MTEVVLAIGTNKGDLHENVVRALHEIEKKIGPIEAQSSFIQTHAVGFKSDHLFLNGVVKGLTDLSADALLEVIHEIELSMGKRLRLNREEPYADRVIDIDIVYYGMEVRRSSTLIIPHPERLNRDFVLHPMVEIIPQWIDPLEGVSLNMVSERRKKEAKVV